MTDEQYRAHVWLSRMWDADTAIQQLVARRDTILGSMSGIGKYDSENIPTQNGENATETKNIEFSYLSEQIEKKMRKIAVENKRTHEVIDQVADDMLQGMLEARYMNRMTWTQVGRLYNYEKSRAYDYKSKALDAVAPFVPFEFT